MPKKRIKPVVYLVEVDDTEDLQAQELDHMITGHDPEDCLLCIEREKIKALLEALEGILELAESEAYALEKFADTQDAERDARSAGRAVKRAKAAIAKAKGGQS